MKQQITEAVNKQKAFFQTNATKDVEYRLDALKKLKRTIRRFEDQLCDALWEDLHKSKFEAYATEIGIVLDELSVHIKNVKKWAKPEKVSTPVLHYKSDSYIYNEPFGTVLVIAPWNYPFQLLFNPLIAAISSGNTAVLKPSPYTPRTAEVMHEIIKDCFHEEYICLFKGGRQVNQWLLEEKFDYIFFTGSPMLGKQVMKMAAENLTPIALELGGKSPCIVDENVNIDVAAKRIVWGKYINAGQTCIAPDYLFVHKKVKNKLLDKMKEVITEFFGENPQESDDFARVVNEANVLRLQKLMEGLTIFAGGQVDVTEKYIAPTILTDVTPEHPIMQEEIFGPLLPVMEFTSYAQVYKYINANPKPLALYFFSEDTARQEEVLLNTSSGGGCINDTLMHIANHNLPFGGVGNSGMGRYHGEFGFKALSNPRAILKKSTLLDVPVRYAPYKDKLGMVKMLLN